MAALQESAVELQQLVTEMLGRFGVAGTVAVVADRMTLSGNGATVETDVRSLLTEWPGLTEETRRKRALDAARRLAGERRRVTSGSRAPNERRVPRWVLPSSIAGALIVLGAGLWRLRDEPPAVHPVASRRPAPSVDYDADERERLERAARVCNATRSRIMRGAPIGPTDVEGWVVELSLLASSESPGPIASPAVASFVSAPAGGRGRIVWPGAGAIASLDGSDTAATVTALPTGAPDLNGLVLVLTGRYVGAYFDESARVTLVRFAQALADAAGAKYAALYARCAAGRAHHLGSFFRGPTPGGAVASLVYFMGAFGDVPDVRRSLLSASDEGFDPAIAFRSIASATAPLKKARIMAMVGAEGGNIAGIDDQPSTITFPPRDPNRASRASHGIARDLGIGENR